MQDPLGAFCRHVDVTLPGAATGPLAGLHFAAKDLYDVAGQRTGGGNPDWLGSHAPAAATAPAILSLVAAGATLVGKTLTDELAYSIAGRNFHYGTPTNVAAPGRIPGGSSSGSAAAVAGKLVDFALGSDTGGSIRIPASLCGLFGMRPSHGRIPLAGVMPLAPSFDTVAWLARDAGLLAAVGEILLPPDGAAVPDASSVLLVEDGFALADPELRATLAGPVAAIERLVGRTRTIELGAAEGGLDGLMLCFRTLQAREVWAAHGAWIEAQHPAFGPDVAARFAAAKALAATPPGREADQRERYAGTVEALLADGAVLCLPTAPSIAPPLDMTADEAQRFRDRALALCCTAGLARLPQISLPVAKVAGCPVGLSLVAGHGRDRALLRLAAQVAGSLGSS
jgi:amidase